MPKHLLDETAEFVMPRIGRHAVVDDELDETQPFDPGFRRTPGAPHPPAEAETR